LLCIIFSWPVEHVDVEHQHVQRHPRRPPHNHSSPPNSTARCIRRSSHGHLHPRRPPPFRPAPLRFASFDGPPSRLLQPLQRRRHLWGLSGPHACGCCGNIRSRDFDTSVCLTCVLYGIFLVTVWIQVMFRMILLSPSFHGQQLCSGKMPQTARIYSHPWPFFFLHQSSTAPF
jgi:hypothetical protein